MPSSVSHLISIRILSVKEEERRQEAQGPPHTDTHTHRYIQTHTRIQTHTQKHRDRYIQTHTDTHTHRYIQTHTRIDTHA